MSIKRVILIEDFAAVRGGATMIAHACALGLRKAGLDVVYLSGDEGRSPVLEAAGVTVHGVGNRSLLERSARDAFTKGLHDANAQKAVRAWLAQYGGPDAIVHLHGYLQTLSPSVFDAMASMRGRIILHAHDFFYVCPTSGYFNFRTGRQCTLTPMSRACLFENCDKRARIHKLWRYERTRRVQAGVARLGGPPVIALHEGMAPILEAGGVARERIQVLANPVEPWCDERAPAENNRSVLYVGRLGEDKGADLLAKACATINAPLTIYGEGPLAAVLPSIYPQAQLMGWGDRAALGAAARQARLLVMPTRQIEAFGLTAFEAGLSGLPVLVSPLALIGKQVEAAGFGLRVNPERIGVLADAIAALMADDARVRAMSEAGFGARHTMALTPAAYIQRLLGLYERTVAAA